MKFIAIYLLFTCFLTLSLEAYSPMQKWMREYAQKEFQFQKCTMVIGISGLFAVDALPVFKSISPKSISTGLYCAQQFLNEFSNRFYQKDLKEADDRFLTLMDVAKCYIRSIRNILLSNDFNKKLLDIDEGIDTHNEYNKLLNKYHKLVNKVNSNLESIPEEITLLIDDPKDVTDFSESYLKAWSDLACINSERNQDQAENGPWLVPYKDFDYILKSTKNEKLRKEIAKKQLKKESVISNKDALESLRTLYCDYVKNVYKDDFDNIVDYKMENLCMASSFKSVKLFLEKLENSFAKEYIKHPYIEELMKQADEKMAHYFPHEHVVHVLFKLIQEYFHILIGKSNLYYDTLADKGFILYDVNVSNERIGLFFIDYFERPGRKVKKTPYTALLRHRVKHLNIIPLVFISLQTKCQYYFTLEEVGNLFHEMGHCLQLILADIDKIFVSGDTHEFPSLFMEHLSRQTHIISKLCKSKENYKEYIGLNKELKKYYRYVKLERIQMHLIDLNLFKSSDDVEEIIKRVKEKFTFQGLSHKKYDSYLPEFNYAGTRYVYVLSEIMAIDAYDHIQSDRNKVLDRYLEFRKLVFEMESVEKLQEAYRKFVGRNELRIDIKPFYEFYDVPFREPKRLIEI